MSTPHALPFSIGKLNLKHRLIQGPLAGFSCAPFRELFTLYTPPAYCVSEMISAHDVVHKHQTDSRYLYRSPKEGILCYQIAGSDPMIMSEAAIKLESIGADIIDINCGCPKPKIRKKGAGSMLLDNPERLISIVSSVRLAIQCPLTVKIRLQGSQKDVELAKKIENAGADALIVHGRRWQEGYDQPCNLEQIAAIKRSLLIPVIANGDIQDSDSLDQTLQATSCDALMIARAGTGKPWIYEELLQGHPTKLVDNAQLANVFVIHVQQLASLESEHQAVLQSKSLIRYYFKNKLGSDDLQYFYRLSNLREIESFFMSL